jgi:hypothetical protein
MASDIFEQAGVQPTASGLKPVAISAAKPATPPQALVDKLQPAAPATPQGPVATGGTSATPTGPTGAVAAATGSTGPAAPTVVNSFQNPDGTMTLVWSDGRTTTSGTPTNPATTTQGINALSLLKSTLASYGIDPTGAVSNAIVGLIQKNYDAPTIQALIEDPNAAKSSDPNVAALGTAWQARFAGNVAREKAGLTPLSPADYINTENSYKAVMARAGLDAAHMDPTKLAGLIGMDVSPAEVNQRINAAMTAITSEDPFVVQQLQQQFNLTNGDLIGHLLDPTTQASVIQNKVTAAQIGAEAARQGTDINAMNAYTLAQQGVTQAQAQQGFQNIAQQLPGTQAIASRYAAFAPAGQIGAALQTATFGVPGTQTQAQAEAELRRLQTQEVSAFSGSSGAGKGSLGIIDTGGLQ